jgi:hypothetical protein
MAHWFLSIFIYFYLLQINYLHSLFFNDKWNINIPNEIFVLLKGNRVLLNNAKKTITIKQHTKFFQIHNSLLDTFRSNVLISFSHNKKSLISRIEFLLLI